MKANEEGITHAPNGVSRWHQVGGRFRLHRREHSFTLFALFETKLLRELDVARVYYKTHGKSKLLQDTDR